MKIEWEAAQAALMGWQTDWEILSYTIERPPKEVAPDGEFRQYVPGDHMKITFNLVRKDTDL